MGSVKDDRVQDDRKRSLALTKMSTRFFKLCQTMFDIEIFYIRMHRCQDGLPPRPDHLAVHNKNREACGNGTSQRKDDRWDYFKTIMGESEFL
jgi:hypothetical protein